MIRFNLKSALDSIKVVAVCSAYKCSSNKSYQFIFICKVIWVCFVRHEFMKIRQNYKVWYYQISSLTSEVQI